MLQWQLRDLVYVCFKLPSAINVLTHLRKCPVFEERNSPQVDTLMLTWFSRDFVYWVITNVGYCHVRFNVGSQYRICTARSQYWIMNRRLVEDRKIRGQTISFDQLELQSYQNDGHAFTPVFLLVKRTIEPPSDCPEQYVRSLSVAFRIVAIGRPKERLLKWPEN